MDPIYPIAPGPAQVPPQPVERLERITRERDRPGRDRRERGPRRAPDPAPERGEDRGEDEGGHPHIDVRV